MKADVHAHENTDATHTKTDSEVQYQYVYTVTILRHAKNKSESLLSDQKLCEDFVGECLQLLIPPHV